MKISSVLIRFIAFLSVILVAVLITTSANAGFEEGLDAYDKGDYRRAYAEWIEAAENGDLAAQRNIGNLYRWGKGTEQNPSRAAYWYYKAAKAGFDRAQFNLAMLYFRGEGVPKDELEAIRWLDKAKEQGNDDAEKILSWLKIEENKAALNVVLNSLEDDEPSFVKEYEKGEKQAAVTAKKVADISNDMSEIPVPVNDGVDVAVVEKPVQTKASFLSSSEPSPIQTKPVVKEPKPVVEKEPKPKSVPVVVKKPKPVKTEKVAEKIDVVKQPVQSESAIKPISYYKKKGILKAHLGSYTEEDGAHKDWKRVFYKKSKVIKKLDKMVVRVDLGAKGIWYRLYAIGDGYDIEDLCDDLKAQKTYCLLTRKPL